MSRILRVSSVALLLALGPLLASCDGESPSPDVEQPAMRHDRWDRLVRTYVDENGWVDYRRLQRGGKGELQSYLEELAGADLRQMTDKDEEKAFWINAYNALCVRKLLDNDIPTSVPRATIFGTNIFTERTYRVAGKKRSLDDIEHVILRPRFKDNRVHAALVCGASSCPRLRPEAYVGKRIDAQLDDECRRWINSGKTKNGERKNSLDRRTRVFYASKIFDWYEEDFEDSDEGILRFIAKYLDEGDREFLKKNRVRLEFLSYDWSLNGV